MRVRMTGLPIMLQTWGERGERGKRMRTHLIKNTDISGPLALIPRTLMRVFCTMAIFSGRQSRPRVPRLMMMPSASFSTSWKLSRLWRVAT